MMQVTVHAMIIWTRVREWLSMFFPSLDDDPRYPVRQITVDELESGQWRTTRHDAKKLTRGTNEENPNDVSTKS